MESEKLKETKRESEKMNETETQRYRYKTISSHRQWEGANGRENKCTLITNLNYLHVMLSIDS